MFNIGPLEFLVLAAIALLVFGPDKLPQLTKDAARMIRALRDMAQGARTQLTSELGPEFANFDLQSLNPKTAIRNVLLGDDDDFAAMNPRDVIQRALRGEDEPVKPVTTASNGTRSSAPSSGASAPSAAAPSGAAPSSAPAGDSIPNTDPQRSGESAPYDPDAT